MYLRLVHSGIDPTSISQFKEAYKTKVIPRLEKVPGCLYVGLILIEPQHDEAFSMTLWDSREHLEAFEQSGVYRENLEDARPYLSGSSEQRIQLSEDMKLEYVTVHEEPTVKSYKTLAQTDAAFPEHEKSYLANLRLLTVKIQPGKMEECRRIYIEEIIPVLKTVKGCRYAFLMEGLEERNEAISITFWNSRRDIDEYEQSGLFEQLNNKLKHTYTGLYRWKMAVDEESNKRAVTSDDLTIQYYSIIVEKSFQ